MTILKTDKVFHSDLERLWYWLVEAKKAAQSKDRFRMYDCHETALSVIDKSDRISRQDYNLAIDKIADNQVLAGIFPGNEEEE